MRALAFVDTETTGLDPDLHEVWEVGLILRHEGGVLVDRTESEHEWFLPVDLSRADPIALNIGRYHDRYDRDARTSVATFVEEFAALTRDAHLVGAVVSFDEERLRRLLRANGECPMWHYHIIDVEALAVGYLHGRGANSLSLPWKSDALSRTCGVKPPGDDQRHTAIGDARWARDLYDACTGGDG